FDDFSVQILRYASVSADTIPNDTIPNDTIPNDTIPNDTIPTDTIPNDTIPNDTIPNDTTPIEWSAWKHKIRHNVVEHFPNPCSGRVVFRHYLNAPHRNLCLEIYDARGKRLRRISLPDSQTDRLELDIGDFPPGTYFYRLTSNSLPITSTRKLTVI
ncbi:MAG: T9SS type A sorting domain-containing protein, partial [Bacteroidia bacterium]|nr:T9SS type A sorting domain-containing protein [Bacteroidia bacterium]